jgi:hypothetical protein
LRADDRVSGVAIDFAEIFSATGRQNFLRARKRYTAKKNEISGDDREHRAGPQFCEEGRVAHGPVEQDKQTHTRHQGGAEKKSTTTGAKCGVNSDMIAPLALFGSG